MRARAAALAESRSRGPAKQRKSWLLYCAVVLAACMVTPSNNLLNLGRRTQLPEIAFRPGDARFLPSCGTQEESCPAAWSAMGDNGIRYKMIRFISGATDSVKTMAVPEFLLDRWPFPDCVTSEGNDPTCLEGAVRRVALAGTDPKL